MKQGWEVKKLGEVCDLITKGTTPTSLGHQFIDEGINFIKVESLTESGKIIPNKVAYISEECHQALKRSQLKENDILFSIAGALGRIGIVNKDILPANTNQALAIIRLSNDANISIPYLAKYFNSSLISDEIEKLKGGAAQQNLSLGQLNNLEIPLPPLQEQQRIVSILDEAFTAIDKAKANTEQNLKNAKELFESELQRVFSNPNWEEKMLKEIGNAQTGTTPKTAEKDNYGNYIPFIKPADVDFKSDGSIRYDNDGLTEKGLKSTRLMTKGSVLMVCIGATIGKVGFVDRDVTSNQQINSLAVSKDYYPKFFYYALSTKNFYNSVIKSSAQATLPIINKGKWETLTVKFPKSLKEQQMIVSKLDALREQTKKLEAVYLQKLQDLEELKKSVLQKAFSGEL